jgi:hypothetical protein
MKRYKVTLKTTYTNECFLVYALNPIHAAEIVRHVEGIKFNTLHVWKVTKATDRTKFDVSPKVI